MHDRSQHVVVSELTDGDMHLTISRADRRNALSSAVLDDLLDALRQAEDAEVRVLIIDGAGEHFSAGADLAEIQGTAADEAWFDRMATLTEALASSPAISIAAISGACLGAGLELAVACDVRVADSGALFGVPAVDMGLLYDPELLRRLVSLVGHAAAQVMLLRSERLNAAEALAAGLILSIGDSALGEAEAVRKRVRARPAAFRDTVRCLQATAAPVTDYWRGQHRASLRRPERLVAVESAQSRTLKRVAR